VRLKQNGENVGLFLARVGEGLLCDLDDDMGDRDFEGVA
jgi:hypothetical protein